MSAANERAVLSILLRKPELSATAFSRVPVNAFTGDQAFLAEAIQGLRVARKPVDATTCFDEMRRRGTLSRVGNAYPHEIAGELASPETLTYHLDALAGEQRLRKLAGIGDRMVALTSASDADSAQIAHHSAEALQAVIDNITAEQDISTLTLTEFLAGDDDPYDWVIPGLLERADRLILTGGEGLGKALALDTPILTSKGWRIMGAINAGDKVYGPSGLPTTVVAATEVMYGRPCYRVTFSDGSEIVADERHQWLTDTLASREATAKALRRPRNTKAHGTDQTAKRTHFPKVLTTAEIHDTLYARGGHAKNHSINVCRPIHNPIAHLSIHPYVMGAWLGDGTSAGSGFTCADQGIVDEIAKHEPIKHMGGYRYSISNGHKGSRKSLTSRLRALGLLNNKHIPNVYIEASVTQRLELLRGLMDTDGCVTASKNSHVCEFTSTNKRIAAGVQELCVGLGIKVTMNEGIATLNGRKTGPKWRVSFTSSLRVFNLDRKAQRQTKGTTVRSQKRYITKCERVKSVPVKCIQVAHKDGLFLAGRSLITTHNSTLFRQMAIAAAAGIHPFTRQKYEPQRVLYVDLENGVRKMRRALRPLVRTAKALGGDPGENLFIETLPGGFDLRTPEDELWLVSRIVALQPSILVTGSLYKMYSGNPNEAEPAADVMRVIDRCRAAADCAVIIEAHSGKGKDFAGKRNMDPSGTSFWLRWPEFGFGIRPSEDFTKENRIVECVSWRGDREERDWPVRLKAGSVWPWEIAADPEGEWSPSGSHVRSAG